jgi:hypothetical protein
MDTDTLIERLAGELGIAEGTIRKWRSRGKVPHHVRHQIFMAAHDQGYFLRTPAFDNFGKSNQVAA